MLDVCIVLAFVVYSVSSGFRNRKAASKNLSEYFLAGRTLPGWKAGLSMAATQYAADTPLLVAGLIAASGIFALWRLWIYALSFLMMGFLFSAPWRRAGVVTDAELTQIRYSGRGVTAVRMIKAFYYGTIINCTVLAMVLVAAVRIAEIFCRWHLWLPAAVFQPVRGVIAKLGITLAASHSALDPTVAVTDNVITLALVVLFTLLYSASGGLRSVVATDVVQFAIAMVATLVYAVVAVSTAGGFDAITLRLVDLYGATKARAFLSFSPQLSADAMLPFLAVLALQWIYQMNSDGTGYLAQRSMGCKSDGDARRAAIVFTVAQVFVRSLLWLPICIALLVLYPLPPVSQLPEGLVAQRELLFARGVQDLLPPGILGLMLTGLLAALASTIDTHMNWGAGYWSNDIYKGLLCRSWLRREPSDRELVWVARGANLGVVLIACTIMTRLGSIRQAWHVSLLFGAGMGAVLVLRWVWERINIYSEMASMLVSLAAAPLLLWTIRDEWLRISIMAAVTTFAVIAVTVLTPRVQAQKLDDFFRRVRPAGFWRCTAVRVGADPSIPVKKMGFALAGMSAAAGTILSGLVACGKLMFPLPGESRLWALPGLVMLLLCATLWRIVCRKERSGRLY